MIRWFARRFIMPFVQRVHPDQKCPACGVVKKHKIVFAREYGVVIHSCTVCAANWGSDPVVPWDKWKVSYEIPPPASDRQPEKTNVMTVTPTVRRTR